VPDDPIARPSFSDIDAWGVTHRGKVRSSNQDHFFLGALARGVTVDRTSILTEGPVLHAERLASLAVVADGVGGSGGGEEAARIAVRDLVSSVSRFFHDAARACHDSLLKRAEEEGGTRHFSTQLLQDALDDGGSDNITVIIGRTLAAEHAGGAT
jgi:serine/threonine protein phosphatase PrpC